MFTEEELREELKQKAEIVIEGVLARRKASGKNSLSELEELVLRAGREIEEGVLEVLVEQESQAEPRAWCEGCGKAMRNRGKRKRQVVSQAGEVQIERSVYGCPGCGKRTFPPG